MKKQKIIFIFLKMILFAVLAAFFYMQLSSIDWSERDFYLERPLFILIVLLLVPLNWFFEWKKWTATLRVVEVSATNQIRKHAFFAGIVTGMLTPNMLGNFIGRIYYFDRKHRTGLVILTLATNYAQFIASMVFGIIAILLLKSTPLDMDVSQLNFILIGVAIILVLFYFNFEWIFRPMKRKARIHLLVRNLNKRRLYRWQILFLSLMRHALFTLQFLLMLYAFGEDFSFLNFLWIWQVYLWVTLVPSLFMGKLAIRETVSIWVLTVAGMGEFTVLISSFLIWTMNLLIPTIVGLIICKRKS